MKSNKGQALIEFIMILPVLLIILISIIDFGNIILKKYSLENEIDTVNEMYKSGNADDIYIYLNKKNISINFSKEEKFTNIKLSKDIKLSSPVLIIIFGKDYKITTEKSVYSE